MIKNTLKSFGTMTKLVHWLIFILITFQFYLIWISVPNDPSRQAFYIMLHKSIGITVLLLGLYFIIWHIITTKPLPPETQPYWQHITAKIVHYLLFILLIAMPIVGYLLVCANGKTVNFFGWFNIPSLISQNKHLGDIMFSIHQKLGYLIIALVGVHVFAAFYHQFIIKDNVLRRILPFNSRDQRKE
ncbi:cytochrome b561 family protein [Legionella gratiana]|uniref:Cytochrome b561 family protein n=1 Tax=Legionella gratiana TaxID=45066 RepID=A0A378JEH3_9GAMM|nr:cytochrome b [Legionella gratiana]KTD11751.1 cytochrome b561 family protein [Legionella gratiana]STX45428.1 cytochrome b561 family protein [Legionella gratiana]